MDYCFLFLSAVTVILRMWRIVKVPLQHVLGKTIRILNSAGTQAIIANLFGEKLIHGAAIVPGRVGRVLSDASVAAGLFWLFISTPIPQQILLPNHIRLPREWSLFSLK
jgi:hypothetical protein